MAQRLLGGGVQSTPVIGRQSVSSWATTQHTFTPSSQEASLPTSPARVIGCHVGDLLPTCLIEGVLQVLLFITCLKIPIQGVGGPLIEKHLEWLTKHKLDSYIIKSA